MRSLWFILWLALPFASNADVKFGIQIDPEGRAVAEGDSAVVRVRVVSGERIGEPQLEISGGELKVARGGAQQSFSMGFGQRTRHDITHQFGVSGKPGTYTIKALVKNAAGETYHSDPVTLRVRPATAAERALEPALLLRSARGSVYVGEPLDVEMFVIAKRGTAFRLENGNAPKIGGEGLDAVLGPTATPGEVIDGNETVRFTARVTPLKGGDLTLSADFEPLMAVRTSTGRMRNKRYPAKAPPLPIEVKQLPTEGRPKGFSGTVGSFQMTCAANPLEVEVGEPISLRFSISGEGNFKSIIAPEASETKGWKFYEPTRLELQKSDSGQASKQEFVLNIVPQTTQTQIPSFQLPIFDPKQDRYVPLFSAPIPIKVTGTAQAVASANSPSPRPADTVGEQGNSVASAPIADMKDILLLSGTTEPSWATASPPSWRKPSFWGLNGALAAALIGISLIARVWSRRSSHQPDAPGFHQLLKATESAPAEAGAFYTAAHRCLAIAGKPQGKQPALEQVKQRYDFLQFSGDNAASTEKVSADERSDILAALRSLEA